MGVNIFGADSLVGDIFGPATVWIFIPIFTLMIPIIALLQHHQQKMAEIIHGSRHRELLKGELEEMRSEIGQLKATVATQALALEGLANRKQLSSTTESESLTQRLG